MLVREKKSGLQSLVASLLLIMASLAAGLILGEILIRWVNPQITYGGGLAYKDDVVFDLKPNFSGSFSHPDYQYTANHDHLRFRRTYNSSETLRFSKMDNRSDSHGNLSILVLGDSLAYGMGVQDDETISSELSKELSDVGVAAHVSNAGNPAYTLAESACKYERTKSYLNPKIVVVTASFNDVVANIGDCESLYKGTLKQRSPGNISLRTKIYGSARDFLLGNSHLAVFLTHRLNALFIQWGLRDTYREIPAFYSPHLSWLDENRVRRVGEVLKELSFSIKREGALGVFVYIPGILEVNDDLWEAVSQKEKGKILRAQPRRFLLDSAEKADFSLIIDPLSDPSGAAELRNGYFPIDGHLNEKGNTVIAKLIADQLIRFLAFKK